MTNTEDLTTQRAPSAFNRENEIIEKEDDDSTETLSRKEKRMNKQSQKRFGHAVQFEKYKTSNPIKIICVTLAICIIPLEIFVQHVL